MYLNILYLYHNINIMFIMLKFIYNNKIDNKIHLYMMLTMNLLILFYV